MWFLQECVASLAKGLGLAFSCQPCKRAWPSGSASALQKGTGIHAMPKRKPLGRGGRHQKKQRLEEKQEEKTWPSFGGLSPISYKLLEKWSWGNSSALELNEIARACLNTWDEVPSDLQGLAALGTYGNNPANIQRDLFRHPALKKLMAPRPYTVQAHCLTHHGVEFCDLSIFLPHDWVACLSENGLLEHCVGAMDDCKTFWKSVSKEDPKLYNNPILMQEKEIYMPLVLHADKGPHSKVDSLHTITMYSLPAQDRRLGLEESSFLLVSIPNSTLLTKSKIIELGLKDVEPTMDVVGRAIAWSFNSLFRGKHPRADQDGKAFVSSERQSLASKSICTNGMRFILWATPADCEHNSLEYGLPHHGAKHPCMRCHCDTSLAPWNDFSPKAKWRGLLYTPAALAKKPLTNHWLLSIQGVNSFTFAYDFMHCADIGFSASAVANVLYDICYKHLGKLKKADKIKKLNDLVTEAYTALNTPHDVRVKRLTFSSFSDSDAPHQHYPSLMHSAIKAKQVARLVPVAAKFCKDFYSDTIYCKHRLHCLQSLEKLYSITHNASMFLTKEEAKDDQSATSRFLRHYECLSKLSAGSTERIGQPLGGLNVGSFLLMRCQPLHLLMI